jgi:beta-galactosidase
MAPVVRLELNGRVIGEKEVSAPDQLTAVFEAPYEPGELKAIALNQGTEYAVKVLRTTGTPAGIRLSADRNPIRADRNDLAYVTIEVVDEFGQLVTDAAKQVTLTVSGDGELIGSGNACPYDMGSFGKTQPVTFRGKAMAIIRPYLKAGSIKLHASGEGLAEGNIEIKTTKN